MKKYQPNMVEPKWQEKWRNNSLFSPDLDKAKKPYYSLMMFPYPSAEGLHVGNMYAFTGSDIFSRHKRMEGYDVFEPIGLDGFGIHSENYALKINKHPMTLSKITEQRFYDQLTMIGNSYDWTRTVETYKPEYYKWTQWLFLQMYKKGLAYRKKAEVNWCSSCKTVLADEQVISGECERCSTQIERRELEQWFFKITAYAEKLLSNLEWIDWSEKVKTAQRNWIGKSQGTLIKFDNIEVFTTRPDTLFGVTFLVVSPEFPLLNKLVKHEKEEEVSTYVEKALKKSELERRENKEKTGVFTGSYVKHPITRREIPVWVADYVLLGYGTGVVMGVPAHDQRDFEFAKKYGLEVKEVIRAAGPATAPGSSSGHEKPLAHTNHSLEAGLAPDDTKNSSSSLCSTAPHFSVGSDFAAYEGEGVLINSGDYNGMESDRAIVKISNYLEKHHLGQKQVQYHLRDWLISRQRYWGPPIPIVYCDKCGTVPVPEEDLPVELPFVENFRPEGTGQSPLASDPDFVNTKCPKCGEAAKRETDVSDTFLDSSWYFYRYVSTEFDDRALSKERVAKWLPVDMYIGGAEHAVLHLLYARFVAMVLKDLGFIDFEEPIKVFRAHGLLIKEGAKISKSKGNVVNPDEYIQKWGADTLRAYLMFMGPFTEGGDFRDNSISGAYHFLERIWGLYEKVSNGKNQVSSEDNAAMHKTIKKVGEDIEEIKFNTAIATLMEWLNHLSRKASVSQEEYRTFLLLLAPFAPHITEELWEIIRLSVLSDQLSDKGQSVTEKQKTGELESENRQQKTDNWSIHQQSWPKYEAKYLEEEEVTIVVQINGKVRDNIVIQKDMVRDSEVVEKMAKDSLKVRKYLEGREIKRVVKIPGKIINFVV
ncbi:MAG: class I tRNA ligase family protein [Candidatus Daviesbacteria bacterium]